MSNKYKTIFLGTAVDKVLNDAYESYVKSLKTKTSKSVVLRKIVINHLKQKGFLSNDYSDSIKYGDHLNAKLRRTTDPDEIARIREIFATKAARARAGKKNFNVQTITNSPNASITNNQK